MKLSISRLNACALATLLAFSAASPAVFAQADARPVLIVSPTNADIATLDPHRATAFGDKGIVSSMFDGLVRFAPGSADPKTLEADLAERWEVAQNNKVWTFHLRKGVQFHGGYGELKAADVVYSLQRAADPKRSSFAANFVGVAKVEGVDDYTVRVILKYPDAGFLGRVSNYHGGNIVSKAAAEKLGDRFGQAPIGTGPFAFAEHVTQQHVRLVANDAYFRGKPKLAGVTFRMISADSARELAFSAGEIDLAAGKREQRWVERSIKRDVKVDIFDPAEFRTLFINRNIKPLDNLKVRQAIAAAINVDEIIRFVGKDVADKGCSVIPNGYVGEDCNAGKYTYDLERAKALLAEAGYPSGITLNAVVSSVAAQLPIMEVVQSQLAKAGVKLNMEVVDHATYQAKSRQDQSAIVFYGAARFPNADYWLTEFYDSAAAIGAPGAMSNFAHCSIADAEIRQARVEPDAARQLVWWKQAQTKIHDDVCGIPLFGLKQVWTHGNGVDYGYKLTGALNLQPPITEATSVKRSTR
jgi:peptide/nickel transport system substrate-binding protein